MLIPSIPFLALLAGAASVTVTAAAGLHNKQTAVTVTAEQAPCDSFNQHLVDAAARVRSDGEAARLLGLRQKCGPGGGK